MPELLSRLLATVALLGGLLLSTTWPLNGQLRRGTAIDYPIVDELIANQLIQMPTEEWVHAVLSPTLAHTDYRRHWSINRRVKVGYLNFYFLKPNFRSETNLPAVVSRYRDSLVDNCAYLGQHGVIICDTDFLRAFPYTRGLLSPARDVANHELGYEGFVNERLELVSMWVIGHEIGHVLDGDGEADLKPGERLGAASSNRATLQQLRTTKDKEYAADLTFAGKLAADKKLETDLVSMLIDLINAELISHNGKPDVYWGPGFALDYSQKKIAYYFDNDLTDPTKRHPEYMVRAVRILQQIAATTHDSGLQALLVSFSYKMQQADPASP